MTTGAAPVAAFDLDVVRQVLQSRAGERVALSHLFDKGAYARSFALPHELDDALRWVEDRASSQHTVSIGVASLSEAGGRRLVESSTRTRPRTGEHAGYAWVAADLDPKVGQEQDTLHAQLARIVSSTAVEYGVNYNAHPSVKSALRSHTRWLKQMGAAPVG